MHIHQMPTRFRYHARSPTALAPELGTFIKVSYLVCDALLLHSCYQTILQGRKLRLRVSIQGLLTETVFQAGLSEFNSGDYFIIVHCFAFISNKNYFVLSSGIAMICLFSELQYILKLARSNYELQVY